MTPLDELTNLETEQELTIIDEHHNKYTGLFRWDSEEEAHYLGEYKLVARYETDQLFIVKPIDDDTISGFLAEVYQIQPTDEDSL